MLQSNQDILQLVGRKIESLRLDRGLTNDELLEKTGLNKTSLNNLKKGAEGVTFFTVIKVLRTLNALHLIAFLIDGVSLDKPLKQRRIRKGDKSSSFVWQEDES